jgi:imidazolonepropionase-like amidohydrolase
LSHRFRVLLLAALLSTAANSLHARALALVGGTILDGNGGEPVRNGVLVMDGTRIVAVGDRSTPIPRDAQRIDAAGKFLIPGMMDANVHLVYDISPEFMLRFGDRLDAVVREGAQVALKNGFTTIFDTWGPLEELKTARDQINRGEAPGSRLFIAGNIVGIDGPLTTDFFGPVTGLSQETLDAINARWEQGVGKQLVYMSPEEIRVRIREYLGKGIDFLKIGISAHGAGIYGFYSFSAESLQVMVDEARARGMTVQTHTMTADALRLAALGNYDLAQHCGTAYRQLSPEAKTLELIPDAIVKLVVDRKLTCTMNTYTTRELRRRIGDTEGTVDLESVDSVPRGADRERRANVISGHQNDRNLIKAGAIMALSTDAGVPWVGSSTIHRSSPCWKTPDECLHVLGTGHMAWFKASHEMGMPPMQMLQAATRNIAAAYRKLDDLGTLEPKKLADVVVLDADPLTDFNAYRKIHLVIKDGKVVDRAALPTDRVLTPLNEPFYTTLR